MGISDVLPAIPVSSGSEKNSSIGSSRFVPTPLLSSTVLIFTSLHFEPPEKGLEGTVIYAV